MFVKMPVYARSEEKYETSCRKTVSGVILERDSGTAISSAWTRELGGGSVATLGGSAYTHQNGASASYGQPCRQAVTFDHEGYSRCLEFSWVVPRLSLETKTRFAQHPEFCELSFLIPRSTGVRRIS